MFVLISGNVGLKKIIMKKYTDDEVSKMIFGDFIREAGIKNPITGEPLSKQKRMNTMYGYVSNSIWEIPISLENRILASKLITEILEENGI